MAGPGAYIDKVCCGVCGSERRPPVTARRHGCPARVQVAHHPVLGTSLDLLVFLDGSDAGLEVRRWEGRGGSPPPPPPLQPPFPPLIPQAAKSLIEALESDESEGVLSRAADAISSAAGGSGAAPPLVRPRAAAEAATCHPPTPPFAPPPPLLYVQVIKADEAFVQVRRWGEGCGGGEGPQPATDCGKEWVVSDTPPPSLRPPRAGCRRARRDPLAPRRRRVDGPGRLCEPARVRRQHERAGGGAAGGAPEQPGGARRRTRPSPPPSPSCRRSPRMRRSTRWPGRPPLRLLQRPRPHRCSHSRSVGGREGAAAAWGGPSTPCTAPPSPPILRRSLAACLRPPHTHPQTGPRPPPSASTRLQQGPTLPA